MKKGCNVLHTTNGGFMGGFPIKKKSREFKGGEGFQGKC
jgi:hypothetical protein